MTNPLYDTLFAPHADRPDAFLYLPDGRQISYPAFLAQAARFAHLLREEGLVPGDRVALHVPKSWQALALITGAIRAGVVFLPLNTAYTARELAYFVENSGARLLICAPEDETALSTLGSPTLTLGAEGQGSAPDKAADLPTTFPTEPRKPEDLAAFLYTSGTTGRSKGAMLSQDNLLSNALTLAKAWAFTGDDVLLHALPIYHTHGLFVATNVMLAVGGSMILLPRFDTDAVMTHLPRATTMMGVPTFYTRLLDDPRFDRAATRHMRLFISGSAPLLAETHERFEARTGHRILERYGMTETNMNTSNPYDGDRRPGTVGPALPGIDVKITDPETGAPLQTGEIGMVEVRGPNVFQGYWQMPEKTREELRADGFFITGDLGQLDADGYLTIVGRGKDLIISGGLNIYPKELETLLDAQPGVLESAVIGVPHDDFGETPLALIVPSPGETPDLDAIRQTLKRDLARFKHPSDMQLIDALPRNTMGKVQKNLLRERYGRATRTVS